MTDVTRRAAIAAALSAASAGCLGYSVIDTSELERRDSRIEGLRSDVNASRRRASELNDTLERSEARVEELEARAERAESDADLSRRRLVLWLYANGMAEHNVAITAYNGGIDSFSSSDYDTGEDRMMRAYAYYRAASNTYGVSLDRSEDAGWAGAADICRDSENRASLMADACWYYALSASDLEDGGDGLPEMDYGDSMYDKASRYEARNLSALENELGVNIDV